MNTTKDFNLYLVTYGLGLLNMVVFFTYGFESFNTITLLDLGANFAPFTLQGEPQRLFYSMFLHGHWLHLGVNMYTLYGLGREVEKHSGEPYF